MTNDYLVECGFLIPIRRDSRLSDGKPHEAIAWDWLYDELFDAFGVVRFTSVPEIADWRDPHGVAVHDQSRPYTVAVEEERVDELRNLLRQACIVFHQECTSTSELVAGWSSSTPLPSLPVNRGPMVMNRNDVYIDMRGQPISLATLDDEEIELVAALVRRAETHPDWIDFDGFSFQALSQLYDGRGVPRSQSRRTAAYRVSRDLTHAWRLPREWPARPTTATSSAELIRMRFKNAARVLRGHGPVGRHAQPRLGRAKAHVDRGPDRCSGSHRLRRSDRGSSRRPSRGDVGGTSRRERRRVGGGRITGVDQACANRLR